MTDFMVNELKRLVKLIPETDPRTMDYTQLMYSLESLINHGGTIEDIVSGNFRTQDAGVSEFTPPSNKTAEPFESSVQFEEAKTDEPAPFEKNTAPVQTYTLPDVRAKLSEVRQKLPSFKISAWINETYGVSNVTKIPEDKYSDAMDKLSALLGGE